ncbi:CRISPR-associated endonuclease Cas1 [Nocardiopsis potens]
MGGRPPPPEPAPDPVNAMLSFGYIPLLNDTVVACHLACPTGRR